MRTDNWGYVTLRYVTCMASGCSIRLQCLSRRLFSLAGLWFDFKKDRDKIEIEPQVQASSSRPEQRSPTLRVRDKTSRQSNQIKSNQPSISHCIGVRYIIKQGAQSGSNAMVVLFLASNVESIFLSVRYNIMKDAMA